MMSIKTFTIAIMWVFSQTFLYGQTNNDIFINAGVDSISRKQNSKTSEIIGIAVPSAMITYGLFSLGDNCIRKADFKVKNSLEKNNRFWYIRADDYLQFAPAVAAYTLKFCKVENRNNLLDMTILYGLSNMLAGGITQGIKITALRERPDKSNKHSFSSGHTATAFVAAEFLHQEYKDKSVFISIAGYGMATFVGVARIYNNKHWLSDVVAGAGIGILSTKAVYWAYPFVREKFGKKGQKLNTFVFPEYSNGNLSLSLSSSF